MPVPPVDVLYRLYRHELAIVDVDVVGNKATYNLNSTVLLEMDIDKKTLIKLYYP